jgi:tetratricopeptide (TPR) repeat protein
MPDRREMARLRQAAEAGDMDAANDLAGVLMDEGDLSGAEQWNRRAAEGGNHDGIVDLGIVLLKQGRFEEAEQWLRKGAADPRSAETQGYCEALLGKCLFMLGRFDEAEQWLAIGAAANIDFAVADLEKIRKNRAEGTLESIRHGSPQQVMQTFDVDSVMFYDGVGHRLGSSVCTLTREKFIIDDARGGIHQIRLRDITGVSAPARKMVRITAPGVAYDLYCRSKDQRYDLEDWLSVGIRRA